jgi:hypothetical protein
MMDALDELAYEQAEQVFGEFLAWVECQPARAARLSALDVVNEALGCEQGITVAVSVVACEAVDPLSRVAAGQGFVDMAACFVSIGETVRRLPVRVTDAAL